MSGRRVATNAYGLFTAKMQAHPSLAKLAFQERSKTIARLWASTPEHQKAVLRRTSQKNGLYVPAAASVKSRRGQSAYHKFVAIHGPKLKGMPNKKRLKEIARRWKEEKQAKKL